MIFGDNGRRRSLFPVNAEPQPIDVECHGLRIVRNLKNGRDHMSGEKALLAKYCRLVEI